MWSDVVAGRLLNVAQTIPASTQRIETVITSRSTDYYSNVQDNKGKGHPLTGHEGPTGGVEELHSFSISALGGVGGQHHAPAALPPGNTRYPLYRRLGGPQGRSGCV
jgi:hypothetical protein